MIKKNKNDNRQPTTTIEFQSPDLLLAHVKSVRSRTVLLQRIN